MYKKRRKLYKVLFVRCSKSFDPNIFLLVEQELKKKHNVTCELIDLTPFFKELSYFEKILDRETTCFAKKIIRERKPDIIVSGNDVAIGATLIKVCNLLGVPSLVIQHGILTERKTRDIMDFLRWRKYLLWRIVSSIVNLPAFSRLTLSMGWRTRVLDWGMGGATKYAVMGNYQKRRFILQGVPPHKIVVTGYSLFDLVPKRIAIFDRRTTFKKLGINEDQHLVLFTTQCFVEDGVWSPKQRRLLAKTVIDSAKNMGLQLIIKVHPREDTRDYKRLSKSSKEVTVLKDFDLHELLLASDVVVTVSSTTGIWALVYGKPLVTITCFRTTRCNFYKGVSFEVDGLEDMPKMLERVLKKQDVRRSLSEKRELFVRDHAYKMDAHASRRIARVILSLVERDAN